MQLIALTRKLNIEQSLSALHARGVGEAEAFAALKRRGFEEATIKAAMANSQYAASAATANASSGVSAGVDTVAGEAREEVKEETIGATVANGAYVTSNAGVVASQGVATGTTTGLAAAFKGLAASIGMSTAALGILTAVVAGFAVAAVAIVAYKKHMKELAKAAGEAGTAWEEQNKSLDENIEKIKELKEALDSGTLSEEEAYQAKSDLLDVQNQLKDSYGEQVEELDLVNGSLEAQIELLKELSKEKARELLLENQKGFSEAERKMTSDKSVTLWESTYSNDEVKDLIEKYEHIHTEELGGKGHTITFSGNASELEEEITSFMNELYDIDKDLYDKMDSTVGKILSENQKTLDENQSTYKQYLQAEMYAQGTGEGSVAKLYNDYAEAVTKYNDALVSGNGVSLAAIEFNKLQKVIDETLANGENSKLIPLFEEIEKQLNTTGIASYEFTNTISKNADSWKSAFDGMDDVDLKSLNPFDEKGSNVLDPSESERALKQLMIIAEQFGIVINENDGSFEEFIDLLVEAGIVAEGVASKLSNYEKFDFSNLTDSLATMSDNIGGLEDAYAEFKDIGFVTAKTLSEIPEALKGMESYDLFESIVGNPESTAKECQEAFNTIVTEYVNSTNMLRDIAGASEDQIEIIIGNLKKMGLTNAKEVVKEAQQHSQMVKQCEADYIHYLNNKEDYAEGFTGDIANLNNQLIAALGEDYADDYKNWLNLLAKKAEAYNEYASQINAAVKRAQSKISYASAQEEAIAQHNINSSWQEYQVSSHNAKKYADLFTFELGTIDTNFGSGFNYTGGTGSGGGSDETKETFNWIEVAISRIQRTITNLGKTVSATYKSWSKRNEALVSEISAVNQEISLQQQAYDYYMKKANSVGLSEHYKGLVQSGAIKIEDITDEKLAEKIKSYQELYEAALEAQDAIQDLEADKAGLVMQKFDNISKEFEDKMSLIEHEIDMIDGQISQTEAKGYMVSAKYYEDLINLEKQNISILEKERAAMVQALKDSGIEPYTEDWYSMMASINDVDKAIQDANTSVIEYRNNIRDLKWEVFDKSQEMLSEIQAESDFLIDLMSDDKQVDDNGNFTDQGTATLGLHAVNFNAYMAQADDYAKEIQEIDKELANDPYNQTLLERRQELLEAQRDNISAAEDEKQTIKDLYSDAYDALLDHMSELIDKRKELMSGIKDLFDYERNIAEQTKEIAKLEKQLNAYAGDDSEESRATIQQIKVSLEEAKQNLEETEYDKYLSDQEQMLDTLYD